MTGAIVSNNALEFFCFPHHICDFRNEGAKMTKSLLIVDDEKLVRWALLKSFTGKEFCVVSASDGIEAMEKINAECFDLIITDYAMPGMNGIEVARKAREICPNVKIIMLTGCKGLLDKEDAKRGGISRIIDKPFMIEEVKDLVFQVLDE